MVHFFGILGPGTSKRHVAPDAPQKAGFFGGVPDTSFGAVPLSRAEQDACFLAGRQPEPAEDDGEPGQRFVQFRLPGLL
jgi:hypothetical protein